MLVTVPVKPGEFVRSCMDAEQILELCSQLDPDHVFWYPTQADPYP
jgi:hypothetical protein